MRHLDWRNERGYGGMMASWVGAVQCTESFHCWRCGSSLSLLLLLFPSFSFLYCPLNTHTHTPRLCLPPSSLSSWLVSCWMQHQVGSATVGCRAALRAPTATVCIRVPGQGPSLQTSMKPFIIWTGCSTVSLPHTCMFVFAACDVSPLVFWIQLGCVSHTVVCHWGINKMLVVADVQTESVFFFLLIYFLPIRCASFPGSSWHPKQVGVFRSGSHRPQGELAGTPLWERNHGLLRHLSAAQWRWASFLVLFVKHNF